MKIDNCVGRGELWQGNRGLLLYSTEEASANRPSRCDAWRWDEMLAAFRALGGTAENVGLGEGPLGRGLFPLDSAKPVMLHAPENLLFALQDVEFTDDGLRIRQSAGVPNSEREFFERYEQTFSWGGGGQSESAHFIAQLDSLPSDVRALLIEEFAMGEFLEGDFAERTKTCFLKSRLIALDGRDVLAPVIELANHGSEGLLYEPKAGLKVEGKTGAEVLVRYSSRDSFGTFHTYGFASRELQAFSVPMTMELGATELVIQWEIGAYSLRENFPVPLVSAQANKLVLSYLMLGSSKFPRRGRGTFATLMREAGIDNADEAYDRILFFNRTKFFKLLAALESQPGEMSVGLRKMARFQLEALAYSIGKRELQA